MAAARRSRPAVLRVVCLWCGFRCVVLEKLAVRRLPSFVLTQGLINPGRLFDAYRMSMSAVVRKATLSMDFFRQADKPKPTSRRIGVRA